MINKKIIKVGRNDIHNNEKFYIPLFDTNLNYSYDVNKKLFASSNQLLPSLEEFNLKVCEIIFKL